MTKFVAIVSGKGGVGKTTAAINIGAALAYSGSDVALLDGNLTTPHVGLYMGVSNPPVTLHDVLAGKDSLKNSTYLHASGLKIIPGSIRFESLNKINLNNLKNVSKKLKGSCETILIDTGAGLTQSNMAVMNMAEEAVIVANPEMASVTDALKTIKKAEEQNILVLGVVLNRFDPEGNEISVENVESILGKPIIATIPESKTLKQAQARKHPLVYLDRNLIESKEFIKVAERLK